MRATDANDLLEHLKNANKDPLEGVERVPYETGKAVEEALRKAHEFMRENQRPSDYALNSKL